MQDQHVNFLIVLPLRVAPSAMLQHADRLFFASVIVQQKAFIVPLIRESVIPAQSLSVLLQLLRAPADRSAEDLPLAKTIVGILYQVLVLLVPLFAETVYATTERRALLVRETAGPALLLYHAQDQVFHLLDGEDPVRRVKRPNSLVTDPIIAL